MTEKEKDKRAGPKEILWIIAFSDGTLWSKYGTYSEAVEIAERIKNGRTYEIH